MDACLSLRHVIDRTADSPTSYRIRERDPTKVDTVWLHQTGTAPGLPESTLLRTRAHALVLEGGEVLHLHPWLARMRYGSGPRGNPRGVNIEHRANLPGRYRGGEGRWWRPPAPSGWQGTADEWRAECDRRLPPEHWNPDGRRAQVLASRALLRRLRDELPALRFVGAHRLVEAGKSGCPGPNLWREVGEWAIRELGLWLAPTRGGLDLPPSWRRAPEIADDPIAPAVRDHVGPNAVPTSS